MALERLLKLIELANDENNQEEARSAAVTACRMLKRDGYRLVCPDAQLDGNWARGIASEETDCAGCPHQIEAFSDYFVNRVDGKRYHQGCLP
jgi:hypothetical protein